jgi:uracil-DNA glycosylase
MPMKRLLAKAGLQADVWALYKQNLEHKPSMKELREIKLDFDKRLELVMPYDYVIAAGETASRLVLDTSSVNINKLRGRDFEYAYGTKSPKNAKNAKAKSDDKDASHI